MFLLKLGRRSQSRDAEPSRGWSAPMMEPIEIYTADRRVSGWLTSGGRRITDLLNETPEVRIWRPAARAFDGDLNQAVPVPAGDGEWYAVSSDEIVVAMPPDRTSHRQVRIHRQLQRVRLEIGPFQVTGGLHVPPGAQVDAYLMRYPHRFVPLTAAAIVHLGQVETEQVVDVAIVNIRHVMSIQPA